MAAARWRRWARACLLAGAMSMLGGCATWVAKTRATLFPASVAPPAAAASGSATEPGEGSQIDAASVPRLSVEAPGAVQALLDQYLELERARRLPDAGTISATEWSRLIGAATADAKALLQTAGYFNPTVTVTRAPATQPGRGETVRLKAVPGPQARVGSLTLDLQGDLERQASAGDAAAHALTERLHKEWPLQPGKPYSNAQWSDAKTAVLARLRAQGYAAATWSGTSSQVDPATNRVDIFVVADSGPLYKAGVIEVEGLKHADEDRVRALAGFKTGTPLTEANLLDYQDRLQKTTLYDQVSVIFDVDPTHAAAARVLVHLREAPLQQLTLGAGVSANTGPRASVEHTYRRVFGLPLLARNKVEWGRDRQAYDGELATHPGPDLTRNFVGGTVERLITDTDITLSQRVRLGRSRNTAGFERLNFVEVEHSRDCAAGSLNDLFCTNARAVSLNTQAVWRRLDSIVLPTEGYTLALQSGVGRAESTYASTGTFMRLYGRATGYWPVGQRWYTQARVELGQVFVPYDVVVPESQRFRAGGDDSVRGYPWRTLSPIQPDGSNTGGKVLFTASAEVAHPISPKYPSVWWATFIDAGQSANAFKALQPVLGYGVGVRWRSPFGPLRLDWAWGQSLHRGSVGLSVGIAY